MSVILNSRTPVQSGLTPLQIQVDGLVGSFTTQATDWRSLAAMMAGGMAYRAGRVGLMGLGSGNGIRVASVGFGLVSEVSAFELTHRGLTTLPGRGGPMWPPALESTIGGRPHGGAPTNHGESNLWRWAGPGGIRQGLLQSFITFGTLKGAGRLARGENVLVQHLLQDSAMVLGHQASGALEIGPRPTGTLAEQFLHAEATNLQIGAGMAAIHRLAPGIHGLERSLDLFRPQIFGRQTPSLQIGPSSAFTSAGLGAVPRNPVEKGPRDSLVLMASKDAPSRGDKGEESNPPSKKGPVPVVERFSRSTEFMSMDLSTSVSPVYEHIERLLRENPVRALTVLMEGEGEPARVVLRLRNYLAERHHSKKMIPQEFALAFLFPTREEGWVIYPHGLEVRSEAATTELVRRLGRLKKEAPSAPSSAPKPMPVGVFQYQGREYQIEGVPSDAEFKEASESSRDAMAEFLEAIRRHMRNSASKSFVFSFGLNHVEPVDMRVRVLELLREKNLTPGPVIAAAVVNDAQAYLFEKKGFQILVYRSPIRLLKPEGSEPAGEDSSVSPVVDLPRAETIPEIFDHFKTALGEGRRPEVVFTGRSWNPDTLGRHFSKWLAQPRNLLPPGEFAIIRMPQLIYPRTGSLGQMAIFSWQKGNRVGLTMEGLPEEEIKR